ncbi:NAD synthase [Ostertagia ostertagi]
MAGGLGVLGDLYKQQVYELAKYINREQEIIPVNILEKAPSAELRPGQKDSDSLPPYPVLDAILYQYIERRQGPAEIIAMGYEETLVKRILKMVNNNEYKRNQFCPIIRVSPKAFGVGRRVPIVGKYLVSGLYITGAECGDLARFIGIKITQPGIGYHEAAVHDQGRQTAIQATQYKTRA